MLRQVFYNSGTAPTCDLSGNSNNKPNEEAVCFGTNCVLPSNAIYSDAKPREVFIAACFLMLIIGIGFYPKLATQIYDVKTVAVNAEVRHSYTQISEANPQIYAKGFLFPKIAEPELATVSGMVE
jgi:NAD(P)H-quinone oxidoreductase subunit 4